MKLEFAPSLADTTAEWSSTVKRCRSKLRGNFGLSQVQERTPLRSLRKLRELCSLRFLPHPSKFLLILMLAACALAQAQSRSQSTTRTAQVDAQSAFQQGEAALRAGKLDHAERDFRAVLAANPQVAGAYANLGVIYMRRKQWQSALQMLRQAEHLAPTVAVSHDGPGRSTKCVSARRGGFAGREA